MDYILPVILLLIGLAVGAGACWGVMNSKRQQVIENVKHISTIEIQSLKSDLSHRTETLTEVKQQLNNETKRFATSQKNVSALKVHGSKLTTIIKKERKENEEKLELLNDARNNLADAFKALSADALKHNNESFINLAQSTLEKFQDSAKGDLEKRQIAIDAMVKPVEKSLKQVDEKLQVIEKERLTAYTSLNKQVESLTITQNELRSETSKLVKALRRPEVRGRWGEIQLKRVVELAGMLDHCDFFEQQSIETEDGTFRPDLVVQLPGNKKIIIDSKVSLTAFLDSIDADDDKMRAEYLKKHAKHVKTHVQGLSKKSYFSKLDNTPEFVVLFLPGEVFFSAALEYEPSLIEFGVEQNVIIATPTTLIALLRAVAYGWREEQLAQNAKDISDLGRELYLRLSQMCAHLTKVGKGLEGATKAYNQAIGSFESRVLVSARKFDDLKVAAVDKKLDAFTPVEQSFRVLQAPEAANDLSNRNNNSDNS